MSELGGVITEAIVHHYGRDAFLERLAHPFWFQSFGAVMGMDWHSSGITTSVIGALKRGLAARQDELGIYVRGGRGSIRARRPLSYRLSASVSESTAKTSHGRAVSSRRSTAPRCRMDSTSISTVSS